MRSVLGLFGVAALLVLLPTASACIATGGKTLAPGDELDVTDHICTLAFLLADPTGLYFATAGHCIHVNETASTPGFGSGHWGVGAYHYLNPETGSESDGSPGEDFALIRIDPSLYSEVSPTVCGWGGPKGIYTETPGSGGVKHFGNGEGMTMLGPTTQQRQGYGLQNDNKAFYWTGDGVPGDSGSAVLSDDLRAVGVLTHLIVAPPDDNGGTHLLRGFQLAGTAGFQLRLVLDGEDPVAVLHEMRANATAAPTTPTTNSTAPSGNSSTNVTPSTSPNGGNSTAPAANGSTSSQGGAEQPAAVQTQAKKSPAPAMPLALLALVAALLARRHLR